MVGGKKSENWSNVWSCAGSQPIDRANNALIAFSMAFKVRIVSVWWGNGIAGNTRAVMRHVGDLIDFIGSKMVSSEFYKGRLQKED